jgi:hypothetical protein
MLFVTCRASRLSDFAALRSSNASFPIVALTSYKMEMKMSRRVFERRELNCFALPELLISSANQAPGMSERNARMSLQHVAGFLCRSVKL